MVNACCCLLEAVGGWQEARLSNHCHVARFGTSLCKAVSGMNAGTNIMNGGNLVQGPIKEYNLIVRWSGAKLLSVVWKMSDLKAVKLYSSRQDRIEVQLSDEFNSLNDNPSAKPFL